MTLKALVDGLRTAEGYSGACVSAAGEELFSENIERQYIETMIRLLRSSDNVRKVSIAARGFTFVGFTAEGYDVLLKLAGRFPVLPTFYFEEPEFINPSSIPELPSKDMARAEAEVALRAFGLVE